MTQLVKAVRSKVSSESFAKKCYKKGCRLLLQDVPKQHLLIDFDKLDIPSGNETKCCDYLFVSDRDPENKPYVAPIELKKGGLDVSEVVAQIKKGAATAKDFLPKKTAFNFRPIAACGGRADRAEREKLRKKENKIKFHSEVETIRLTRCGSRLIDTLRKPDN